MRSQHLRISMIWLLLAGAVALSIRQTCADEPKKLISADEVVRDLLTNKTPDLSSQTTHGNSLTSETLSNLQKYGFTREFAGLKARMDKDFQRFDKENNLEIIHKSMDLATSHTYEFGERNSKEARDQRLRLLLLVIAKCDDARDKTYDLNHPPRRSTVVGGIRLKSGAFIYSGCDPKSVKEPEARRQYEEAIAENNRRKAKARREYGLEDNIRSGISSFGTIVRNLTRPIWNKPDPVASKEVTALITEAVKDAQLRERILRECELLEEKTLPPTR